MLFRSASGTTLTLTAASVQNWAISGSGGQTIQLPNATTLPAGATFTFNNNQSSGTIVIQNNSATTIATVQSGSYITVVLLNNSSAAGSWDYHNSPPSNASWSTNTLNWAGSYTNGTWNGNAIGIGYGGTGQTTAAAGFNALSPITTAGDLIIGNGANSATRLGIGTNGYVLTSNGTTATWAASTGGVTSFSAGTTGFTPSTSTTGAITLSGTLGIANGGTGLTSVGTNGTVLTSNGTTASWATPSATVVPINYNLTTVSSNLTIVSGQNGFSVGPVTINSGNSVTVTSGQRWVVI